MGGLEDAADLYALTYEGKQYADLLRTYLPKSQEAPYCTGRAGVSFGVGRELFFWERCFTPILYMHHRLGPSFRVCGTSHIVWCHATMGRRRPQRSIVSVEACASISTFEHRRPFPTQEECAYLFHVAERVTRFGVIPKSLTSLENGKRPITSLKMTFIEG
jgi:hypothetical protein